MTSPWEQPRQPPLRSPPVAAAPHRIQFPYNRGRLLRYVLFAGLLVIAGIWLLLRTPDWETRLWAVALVGFAAAVVVVYGRMLFDKRPAVMLSARGLTAQRLGYRMIPWTDIEHARMRWEKRTLLWVIPLDVPSLAVAVNIEASFWRSGGPLRKAVRWLSKKSGDNEVRVPLAGLDGGRPERVVEAIRIMHPELIRETIITEIES